MMLARVRYVMKENKKKSAIGKSDGLILNGKNNKRASSSVAESCIYDVTNPLKHTHTHTHTTFFTTVLHYDDDGDCNNVLLLLLLLLMFSVMFKRRTVKAGPTAF
jgi:hypothetical protein